MPLQHLLSEATDAPSSGDTVDRQKEKETSTKRKRGREREGERRWGRAKIHPAFAAARWAPTWSPLPGGGGHRATRNSWHCHVYYLYINPRQQELSSIHWQVVEYCNTVTVRNRVEEKQKTMPMEERGPVTLSKEPLKVCRHLESV